MNKKGIYTYGLIFIILLLILTFLIVNKFQNYVIICGVFTIISFIALCIELFKGRSAEAIYDSELNRILKTYDVILSSIDNLPELKDRSLIIVNNIEDLVNAQAEIRKPIFYKKELESCVFIILDDKEACVYTLRLNDNAVSPLDAIIEAYKSNGGVKDSDILDGIDKTTIIRLENKKAYKVSPIRDKQEKATEIETEAQEEIITKPEVTIEEKIKVTEVEEQEEEEQFTEPKLRDDDFNTVVIPMLKDENIADLTKEIAKKSKENENVMNVSDEDLEKLINEKVKKNSRKKK